MKRQAWSGSGRPRKCDTELNEASEEEVKGHPSQKEQHVYGTEAGKITHSVPEELK